MCMDDVCLDVTKQESQREREFARALVCECAEVREREGRKEQKRDIGEKIFFVLRVCADPKAKRRHFPSLIFASA